MGESTRDAEAGEPASDFRLAAEVRHVLEQVKGDLLVMRGYGLLAKPIQSRQ